MTFFPSSRAGIYGASAPLTPPAPLDPFDSPGTPTPGTLTANASTLASNSITAAVGDRLVLLFTQTRGSISSPGDGLRSLSSIVGTGAFAGLSFDIATQVIATHSQTLTGNNGGCRASVASMLLPEGYAGTGTLAVTWSGTTWTSLAQAFVLPPCSVVAAMQGGAAEAVATIALSTAETLEANDLIFSAAGQLWSDTATIPTGFTQGATYTRTTNDRHYTAWKNGTLGASPWTWAGLRTASGGVPKAAAAAIFRRTAL